MENELNFLNNYILKQTTKRKIELLENAYDESFKVFWSIADILLKAPCGEGGGLPTEVIDEVFQRKLKKKK
jgi:hypothetical protein